MATSRKRSRKELRATAYHEAGHAVISIAQGYTINKVSIIPDERYNGECDQPGVGGYEDVRNQREVRKIARALIITAYAGMEAEKLVDPDPPAYHGKQDEENAFTISRRHRVFPRNIRVVGDEYHQAYLERLRSEARQLVMKHRKAIDAVAEQLLQRQELGRAEAEQIIEPLL